MGHQYPVDDLRVDANLARNVRRAVARNAALLAHALGNLQKIHPAPEKDDGLCQKDDCKASDYAACRMLRSQSRPRGLSSRTTRKG